jgi:hypothetical protein
MYKLGLITIKSIFVEGKNKHRIIMAERKPNRQRFQKDNGIKRILLVDDEYDITYKVSFRGKRLQS